MVRREPQLVVFTIFTQMSAGLVVVWGLAAIAKPQPGSFVAVAYTRLVLGVVLLTLVLGVLVASLHLGQPGRSPLALANLRHSWLSREALAGLGFGGLVALLLLLSWTGVQVEELTWFLMAVSSLVGLGLVWGISRLYMLRTVPVWNHPGTPAAFFTTSLLLGSAALRVLWVGSAGQGWAPNLIPRYLDWALVGLIGLQGVIAFASMAFLSSRGEIAAAGLRVVWSRLRLLLITRWLLAFGSMGLLFVRSSDWGGLGIEPLGSTLLVFIGLLASEVIGRWIFYGSYRREGI